MDFPRARKFLSQTRIFLTAVAIVGSIFLWLERVPEAIAEGSKNEPEADPVANLGTELSLDVFLGEPIDGFPGWRASPWYQDYYVDFWAWIYHNEHGWQWVTEDSTAEVIFLWDIGLGEWLFVNQATYRWFFLFGDNPGWIWTFDDNLPQDRYFQRFDDGSLISIPAEPEPEPEPDPEPDPDPPPPPLPPPPVDINPTDTIGGG